MFFTRLNLISKWNAVMLITEKNTKTIVITGLPNTGKSQVFNNLTGQYTIVSNYAFTTVEMRTAQCQIHAQLYEITDTPGLHCLYIHSEEELMVRDMLLSKKPDVLIQCIDANRLKQSLTLTADLLELGIPMVISLNAVDETAQKGMWIDFRALARYLGVPVVESVATHGIGTEDLKKAITQAGRSKVPIKYGDILEQGIRGIESILPKEFSFGRKSAILMLLNDPYILNFFKKNYSQDLVDQLTQQIALVKNQYGNNINWLVNSKRNKWIEEIVENVVKKQQLFLGGFSNTFAQLSRHPIYGIPILSGILYLMYFLVVNVANEMAGWMDTTLWTPVADQISNLVPSLFWNDFLIGDYGVLSLGVANAFITVLPILSVFFLAFSMLEDSGYIPNLCVLVKRVFDKVGLSGGSIMSLVLGFGCKTMATLTTKSLRSKKEKYIAIYLIAFAIPCAPQMGLNMSILGRLGPRAFIIAFSSLLLFEIGVGLILNKILKEDKKSDFMQELPAIRLPNPKAVLTKTYYRLYWFLQEAVPLFIYAALALFVIDRVGILDALKNALSPIINGFLGLPSEMVDALLLTMARHEAAAGMIIKLIEQGKLNYVQCIVAVTITTMFVPCFANIVSMIKELGAKTAITMVMIINSSAFVLAGFLNWALNIFF